MRKPCVFAVLVVGVSLLGGSTLAAQSQPRSAVPTSAATTSASAMSSATTSASAAPPVANAVSHVTKAQHYRPGANVKMPFPATNLMIGASGEAKIEAKKTVVTIDAKIEGVEEATKFGLEYLTAKADQQLTQAEHAYRQKQGKTAIDSTARETTQTAEEARVMAVKQKAEDEAQARIAAEKKAAEEREAKARADATAEAKRRADAEMAEKQAQAATAEAQRMKAEAEAAAQEAARQKEEAEQAKAEALAQQQALAQQAAQAQQAAAQSEQMRQQAEQLRQQAEVQRQQAEKEKQELRARLLQQLNTILATRDSARGLIANMSDVLFKSGSYELLPGARERLAKISGIVLAYPTLHLQVEGHTDSVGSDEYNQDLSEHRAEAVRDYLVQQGITANSIGARGLGKTSQSRPMTRLEDGSRIGAWSWCFLETRSGTTKAGTQQ